jgi:methionine-rich copper-binding protein CopC
MSVQRSILLGGLLAVAPMALHAVPFPHLKLSRSLPAADSVVTVAPKELKLWFSEAPELPLTKVSLTSAAGATVSVGKPTLGTGVDAAVVVPVTGAMSAGKYTVSWRAGSKDGHPVHGTFAFTVAK